MEMKEVILSAAYKSKDCCDSSGNMHRAGMTELKGSGKFVLDKIRLPVWEAIIHISYDFGFGTISFDCGVFYNSGFSIDVNGGARNDASANNNCAFGEVYFSGTVLLETTSEPMLCTKTAWTSETCVGMIFTTRSLSLSFTIGASLNKYFCSDGFPANMHLGAINYIDSFKVAGFSSTYTYTYHGYAVMGN